MNSSLKIAIATVLMVIGLVLTGFLISYRFTYPELTNTQMLMTYWEYYVGIIFCFVVGGGLIESAT